ncbi:beta-galactosidase [Parvularcula flava]|uniref:Beta-galactosidase n=1 Tax=Aquisalinus luteolus TaxID=1566827 RepID=A0A8J3ESC0_9PROT|nr:DUF5597 domain-containing protein [Aquisalinus luteolus]NHK29662.1 beta-galactosidase [Aquisalinus luteolus]GGI02178.1 beta-galactosidase [Aquisalinus luteolus]
MPKILMIFAALFFMTVSPQAADRAGGTSMPQFRYDDGRAALFVDGQPFLMLCAQTNNSSNYPAALDSVWEMVDRLGANTLQIPVAWEQVEPVEGQYDFSFVDMLVEQARERGVRFVPLWFGAFKNTSPSYSPAWVKLDNERFPRMVRPDGDNHYALSPHTPELLEVEKKAFIAFMQHLKKVDPQHTVIMVQVENEVGVYGLVRDHSTYATSLFERDIPASLAEAMNVEEGSWQRAFGEDADEYFTAYGFARYTGELAEAGRAVYDLPMYTNAALRHPTAPAKPGQYATGGPTFNVLDIWKAGAPAIDMLSPDIYLPGSEDYSNVLDQYQRTDNALFVSETGANSSYPRYFFEVIGRGAVGFSPFGIDDDAYKGIPRDVPGYEHDAIEEFAKNYRLLGDAAGEWARLGYENGIWGAGRPDDNSDRLLDLGQWQGEISFDEWPFGYRAWSAPDAEGLKDPDDFPNAGVIVAKMDDDRYLVTGRNARIEFTADEDDQPGRKAIIVSADEVMYENGAWVFQRRWNGDQTDYGLNFTDLQKIFIVTLGSYEARNESRSLPKSY